MHTTLTLVVMLVAVLALSGIFMSAMGAFAVSETARRQRTRKDKPSSRVTRAAHRRARIANSIVSTGLFFGVTIAFRTRLFAAQDPGVLRTIGEAAAALLLYDFGYYFLHRFVFHGVSFGRRIHAFHHSIRTPYAIDSLYVHPVETALGVGLFLASVAIVGPIGMYSFGLAFLVYSLINIWVHSAVDLTIPGLRVLSALVRHHDIHHESMKSGFYCNVTPLWDHVFGTAKRTEQISEADAIG